jgi:hypothetical protein
MQANVKAKAPEAPAGAPTGPMLVQVLVSWMDAEGYQAVACPPCRQVVALEGCDRESILAVIREAAGPAADYLQAALGGRGGET